MFRLEKIAEWWEGNQRESQEILQNWVNTSNSDFGLYSRAAVATAVDVSMTLGGGLVDILRIGEGVEEGGWGYARDGIRLLALAGPFLRLGRLAAARWTFNPSPSGNLCASVAAAQTLRQTGTTIFVSAKQIFHRTGCRPPRNLNEFLPVLRSINARVTELPLTNLSQLNRYLQANNKSVILFSVRWRPPRGLADVAHALYAYRNSIGQFKIADRTGRIVNSLSQLENVYSGISNGVPQGSALLIQNSIIVEGTTLASMLALEVNVVLVRSNDADREVQIFPVE